MGGLSNPKRNSRRGLRLLFGVAIVVVGAVVAIVGAYYFDLATESRYFCGVLCHPNRPQYVAQEVSPHADVECGTCHIGPGLLPKVQAKIAGTGELFLLATNQYERPIEHPVNNLKPADVICEQCHTPTLSNDDEIARVAQFAQDEANTETQIDLAVRVGGGSETAGVSAAHWHVDHVVSYIARDADKQDIPWVAVTGADGQVTEYQIAENAAGDSRPLSAEERTSLPQRQMDCIDCHNRATHAFRNPEEWVNELMASGEIDPSLPYVKREAMRLLTTPYETQEAGLAAMDGLAQFYQSQYPSVYADQEQAVQNAVAALQDVYEHTTFPSMNLTWESYPDNLGHTDFPGCFRCHDGAHVNAQGEPISNNCTLCHSAPIVRQASEVVDPSQVVNAVLDVPEPASHREATFIWGHRLIADETCAECHETAEFGTDNSSFCANSVCHGQQWPELAQFADFQHPVELVGAHAEASCDQCHQGTAQLDIQDCASCHQAPEATHFGPDCANCHTPEGWVESASSRVSAAPNNPHGVATVDCLVCHEAGGVKPEPADHEGIPSVSCVRCHETTFVAQVPAIPHAVAADQGCLSCHQGSLQPVSDFHQGIPDASCLGCHTSQPIAGVPVIPHAVEVGARCLACHDQDRLVPEPDSHSEWPEGSCLLCHEPSTAQ